MIRTIALKKILKVFSTTPKENGYKVLIAKIYEIFNDYIKMLLKYMIILIFKSQNHLISDQDDLEQQE